MDQRVDRKIDQRLPKSPGKYLNVTLKTGQYSYNIAIALQRPMICPRKVLHIND